MGVKKMKQIVEEYGEGALAVMVALGVMRLFVFWLDGPLMQMMNHFGGIYF